MRQSVVTSDRLYEFFVKSLDFIHSNDSFKMVDSVVV